MREWPKCSLFGIADAYCKANNLDISPEANSGRGLVDFKISGGYTKRMLVEVKWSKNPKLVHGFQVQLEEYGKAESTELLLFLVIQVSDSRTSIEKVQKLQAVKTRAGERVPGVKIIDGRPKDSASHFDPEE